jgi:predicted Zn-dependent peptidase
LIQVSRLPNGAQVVLETVENTEVVSLGLWQLDGSRDESETEAGFSHFLEHMLFKGTGRRSAYQIAQEIERVGGYLNAFTEKEVTCFHCTLPAESVEVAIDVLCDMYLNSVLDEQEIEKEKSVVLNEIKTVEDNPDEMAHQLYLESMWDGHALSRKITGESAQVQGILRASLDAFYHSRYLPGNTVVTVSGKLVPERVIEGLDRGFADAAEQAPASSRRKAPVTQLRWSAAPGKFEQVHLYSGLAYPPSADIGDYYRDLVFNTFFGESMSSRLFQRLREELGLCYSVYSFRTYFTDVALWTIYMNTVPGFVPAALEALNEELGRLCSSPPTEAELDDAKSQLKGNMVLAREDMENRMKRLFRQLHLTHRVVDYDTSFRLLEDVSRDDVLRIIEKRIHPGQFNLLAYGSRKLRKLSRNAYSFPEPQ